MVGYVLAHYGITAVTSATPPIQCVSASTCRARAIVTSSMPGFPASN